MGGQTNSLRALPGRGAPSSELTKDRPEASSAEWPGLSRPQLPYLALAWGRRDEVAAAEPQARLWSTCVWKHPCESSRDMV